MIEWSLFTGIQDLYADMRITATLTNQRDNIHSIEHGLWPNMLVVVRIPGAMPLAMLYMALGQKTFGCFALPGTALLMAFGHGFVRQRRWSL